MIITIDGPSGTGKTTVAKRVAHRLGFAYFDTGAMYRAFTWFVCQKKIDLTDSAALDATLHAFDFKIVEKKGVKHYFISDEDVTEAIRSSAVTYEVSAVSAIAQVRTFLLNIQHRFAKTQNAVFEGRDLGTVVFPDAEVKIFLTADPKVRAERRLEEILIKNPLEAKGLSKEEMLKEMMRRDAYDSTREVAPLRCPKGAFTIDTTHLSIDQVVAQIVNCTHVK